MNDEMMQTPSLTLEPFADDSTKSALQIPAAPAPVAAAATPGPALDESALTPEERTMIEEFSSKIDLSNSQLILQYGVGAQKKISDFSESALNSVRTKDLGEIGQTLSNVVTELKSFDVEEADKGIFGIFKRGSNKLTSMRAKYDKANANIQQIVGVLEGHQIQLMKDVAMLDKMYDLNKVYFKELSLYILAGRRRLAQTHDNDLKALTERAHQSGLPEDAQAANDLAALCDRFDKKLHDLELTRMISIQMAPQIRLVQNNDTLMSEKIQSTLVNTIPLWKSQMVLAIGVTNSQQAAAAQREVTDMTNDLLRKNAATLKMATIETAKESERGVVDIETLRETNQQLISTLDEVVKIQEEGRQKRREAEMELGRIENELKQKLLDIRG